MNTQYFNAQNNTIGNGLADRHDRCLRLTI